MQRAEEAIRKRVCLGNHVNTVNLVNDLEGRFNKEITARAIANMVKNQELREIRARKILVRER